MKYTERKEKILSALHFHESMSVQQMVELLKSSPATVRRDIVRLEEEGEVERYWGGIRRKETPENRRRNTLQSQEPDEAHAFRRPMEVGAVRYVRTTAGLTGFAVCPRCRGNLEREYQTFCDRCGQKLDWKDYKKVRKIRCGRRDDVHT